MDYQAEEYLVVTSDEAESDLDSAYLSLLQKSYHSSLRWYLGARAAIDSLSIFPCRCPLARENKFFPDHEVRQLLYGAGRNAYRIIFIIFEGRSGSSCHSISPWGAAVEA